MKRSLATVILAVLASLATAGAARAEDAATLYNSKCAACHGKDGKAETTMGKKLALKPFDKGHSAADRAKVIAEGKGKMPSYKGKLSDADIQALAAYVATLK